MDELRTTTINKRAFTIIEVLIGIFFIFIIFGIAISVNKRLKREQPKTASQRFAESAEHLASNPSDWRSNSQTLVQFINAAVDVGLSETSEVKDFKADILDLISFSTTWVDKLDQSERDQLQDSLKKIVADARINALQEGEVAVTADTHGKATEHLLASTTKNFLPNNRFSLPNCIKGLLNLMSGFTSSQLNRRVELS